jgi:hypothetical protein
MVVLSLLYATEVVVLAAKSATLTASIESRERSAMPALRDSIDSPVPRMWALAMRRSGHREG